MCLPQWLSSQFTIASYKIHTIHNNLNYIRIYLYLFDIAHSALFKAIELVKKVP